MKSINIDFPLRDNTSTNTFLQMTQITKKAYSADLLLLLLTERGERYYEPDYGTNLLKYIFEPNDSLTASDIEEELKSTVKLYLPSLTVNKVDFIFNTDNAPERVGENELMVIVDFTFSEDSFTEQGTVTLNF